jgi:hypothetical protein
VVEAIIHTMSTATMLTIILVVTGGACEFAAAYVAFREFRRISAQVPALRAPQHQILEVLATTQHGVNTLLLDRVVQAVLAQWSATRSGRIAVTVLVPAGIVLGVAGDVLGAVK